MRYLELRRLLVAHADDATKVGVDPGAVYFDRYDRGTGASWIDNWNIRVSDGRYQVGFVERGRFDLAREFDTEEQACDWLWEELSAQPPPAVVPAAEIDASKRRMQERRAREQASDERGQEESNEL